MTTAQICILMAIVLYMAIIVAVGVIYSKRNQNADDFYLGGRQLGPIVTAMSAEASDMSSWLLMGLPGVAYISGVADAAWTAIGLAIGTYLNWLFVAKRLRRYSVKVGNAITIPEFFKKRYRDDSNVLICVAAIVILVFFIPYTASGFAACGKLFSSLFGIDYMAAMLISALVIVFYTMLGGFLAASTTDLIQSVVMTIALVVVVIFGIRMAGGWDIVAANANAIPGYLSMTHMGNVVTKEVGPYGLITIVSTMAWGLGYFGMPHILLRFMAIKDENKICLSRRIATVWVVISMAVAILIGIVGYGVSQAGAIAFFETSSDAERTVIALAQLLSENGIAFALMAGVILAGILACTMSTSDSQLLAASSAFSQNLLVDVFGCKISEKGKIVAARTTVIAIAVISIFIARNPDSSVFSIVSFAWAGFGAAFGPVMLFSLFWRRTNRQGAIAGMLAGGVMVFVWKYLVRPMGGLWNVYELLPAFLVGCVVILLVSFVTKAPSEEIIKEFDEVAAGK